MTAQADENASTRSSQSRKSRHMLLNTRNSQTLCFTAINRSTGQTTHAQEPGPVQTTLAVKTNARIQMHQNLFTLTKNKIRSSTIKLGANIQIFPPQTFSGIVTWKSETRFSLQQHPSADLTPLHPENLHTKTWWRWTESNRRPPACKAGALPIELHPQINTKLVVGQGGLEPPTPRLSSVCSNQLSY